MSALARTCLRLAACAALRDVTMAGAEVFDTRLGELPSDDPQNLRPIITVFTEEQSGNAVSSQNGGPPFRTTVELVLEIAMAVAQRGNDDSEYLISYPSTSSDLEASLDLIEAQCQRALFESMAPNSVAFRKAFLRADKTSSVRFAQVDAQDRVALRYVSLTMEVPDDAMLRFDPTLSGLDLLPKTFRSVAALWAEGSPELDTAMAITAALAQPGVPLLKTLRINPADNPPATGPVENWTPPTPEAPGEIDGLPHSADWNMQP